MTNSDYQDLSLTVPGESASKDVGVAPGQANPNREAEKKIITGWRDYFDRSVAAELSDHARVGFIARESVDFLRGVVVSKLGNMENRLILDAGAGDGQVTSRLVGTNRVIALDVSLGMLRGARRQGLGVVCGEMCSLPFRDEAFDAVFCVEAMSCLARPLDVIEELARTLKRGGTIIVSGLNAKSLLRRATAPFFDLGGGLTPSLVSPDHCRAEFERCRFSDVSLTWVTYFINRAVGETRGLSEQIERRLATNFVMVATKTSD